MPHKTIEIKDYAALKKALSTALKDYESTFRNRFFSPGKEGRARHALISERLSAIVDLEKLENQTALSILLSAIVESKIFTSVTSSLKEKILTQCIGNKTTHSLDALCGSEVFAKNMLAPYKERLNNNLIFKNLGSFCKLEPNVAIFESEFVHDANWHVSFQRTNFLKSFATQIAKENNDAVKTLVAEIDNAELLLHKRQAEVEYGTELKRR